MNKSSRTATGPSGTRRYSQPAMAGSLSSTSGRRGSEMVRPSGGAKGRGGGHPSSYRGGGGGIGAGGGLASSSSAPNFSTGKGGVGGGGGVDEGRGASMGDASASSSGPQQFDEKVMVVEAKGARSKTRSKDLDSAAYDASRYNIDGSLRTIYCMPDFNSSYAEAEKAKYIRFPKEKTPDHQKEISIQEIFGSKKD